MRETSRATTSSTSRGLSLLGGWQLVVDGDVVALGGREQRLCALLALGGTRARAQVAGILWPDSIDARALASLRRAVAQTHQRCAGLLAADRTSIGLAADVVVDVDALRAAVTDPVVDRSLLVTLAGEKLLPGWYDEWVEEQRDDLERERVGALERLAGRALEQGDTGLAEDAARAVARLEPLRESASELLIRALLGRDDRAGAVRELERYREVVGTELGVVPSPALVALVEAAPVARVAPVAVASRTPVPTPVPVPDRFPDSLPDTVPIAVPAAPPAASVRTARPVTVPTPRRARPLVPPPPPSSLSPTGPAGSSWRATAARLAVGAALVLAVALSIANLGPDGEEPAPAAADGAAAQPTGLPAEPGGDGRPPPAREVLVRPVAAVEGAAAFVVRATQRPARVRFEVAGPSGSSVVRSVVVRSRDGNRLVLGGLDGGTYEWSATSPTAAPVAGQVRVDDPEAPALAAAGEPSRGPSPAPAPTSNPTSNPTSSPTSSPSPTPTDTPTYTPTPTPTPTQNPTPTPTPTHDPSPSQTSQPSPTRHPSPSGTPTDPGTQDPGPVG